MNSLKSILLEETRAGFRDPRWAICFALILFAAFFHISKQLQPVAGTSLYKAFVALGVLSPTFMAVALLRLLGVPWRRALLLLFWMPLAFFASLLLTDLEKGVCYGMKKNGVHFTNSLYSIPSYILLWEKTYENYT